MFTETVVLIPSHSLEDFPTDIGEKDAAGLLNSFAVAWHPELLATTRKIPLWHRADEPPETLDGRLVFAPSACNEWLPGGWVGHAELQGATVVAGLSARDEIVAAATRRLGDDRPAIPADLVADFLALGTAWLQMELLTRHMHYYSNIDEAQLERVALAAADAAVALDAAAAKTHLKACFEVLLENRERFYPVDSYLIDVCLVIPRLADEHLAATLSKRSRTNFLLSIEDLAQIARDKPELIATLRESWAGGAADFVGGEWRETPSTLLPIQSLLDNFERGRRECLRILGRSPKTWGRRRYGLSPLLPQLLARQGFHSALHLAMDDGLYPDAEQSKVRWQGCDGTTLDAMTRIPLAADSASSFLRFPQRMAESMEGDQVAAVVFARWPEVKTPWFDDFARIHSYAAVFGRFVTFDDFISHTDTPGRLATFEAKEYLTPYFIQAVARRERGPVVRLADHIRRRHAFDAAATLRGLAAVLLGRRPPELADDELARAVEETGADEPPEDVAPLEDRLAAFRTESARELARVVMSGAKGTQTGWLVLNPLSFARKVTVDLPAPAEQPKIGDVVKAAQFDGTRRSVTVEVPGCGFAWFAAGTQPVDRKSSGTPTAEENLLRNELFEVHLSEVTGGIRQIKGFGRSPNRLSQQLAFRFPRERVIPPREEGGVEDRTCYSEMRCMSSEIACDGPGLGEIVTTGDIVDQKDDSKLAGYKQTFRVWRGRPVVEVEIELDVLKEPEGDPWSNYFASRFAWNDTTAALTRSLQQGAHGFLGERIESPHYLEIAAETQRTTIIPCGLPYHRKTGPRMIDSILVAEGERRRQFRFVIAIDEPYPLQAALDAMVPASVVATESGPPRSGSSGWLFHLDARNVQLLGVVGPAWQPHGDVESWVAVTAADLLPQPRDGFALRLAETEGRARQVRLRCFRDPQRARQRDFRGDTLAELKIEGDAVVIGFSAYEIVDLEIAF